MSKCEHKHVKSGALCDVYRTSCGVEYVEDRTCRCDLPDYVFCPWCGHEIEYTTEVA